MLTFICYIEVYYFLFAFLDCVCYNEDVIKLRFVINRGFVPLLFDCNFGWAEENRLSYQGLCYMEVR